MACMESKTPYGSTVDAVNIERGSNTFCDVSFS